MELSQKMRVIPTFSFYGTLTIEPKWPPARKNAQLSNPIVQLWAIVQGIKTAERTPDIWAALEACSFPNIGHTMHGTNIWRPVGESPGVFAGRYAPNRNGLPSAVSHKNRPIPFLERPCCSFRGAKQPLTYFLLAQTSLWAALRPARRPKVPLRPAAQPASRLG